MAARRLVVVMLVLLFISSLAAALAPVRPGEDRSDSTSTTSTTSAPEPPAADEPEGRLVKAVVKADGDGGAKRPTVRAGVGDQLQLRVDSRRVATVEVAGLGATEGVAPLAPARFDLLLTEAGRYPIRFLESREQIATLVVERPPSPRAQRERAPGRGSGPPGSRER